MSDDEAASAYADGFRGLFDSSLRVLHEGVGPWESALRAQLLLAGHPEGRTPKLAEVRALSTSDGNGRRAGVAACVQAELIAYLGLSSADLQAWLEVHQEFPRQDGENGAWLERGHALLDLMGGRAEELESRAAKTDMRRETERFARAVFREEGGSLHTLLTAPWSMLNAGLATYYGQDEPAEGWARVDMGERAGILTTGGVLSAHASETFTQPVHRGLFVRTRVFCQELRPAPPGAIDEANDAAEELPEDMSERERLAAITEDGPCASCHSLMNSIGYGFEAFDSVGRFRTSDATGAIVDINGSIEGWGEYETDVDGSFIGAHELTERLAQSEDVARCVSRQWFRFATQRRESPADENGIEAVHAAFAASGYQIGEAMVAITGTDAFLHRASRLAGE